MLVIVALGGNALARPGRALDVEEQRAAIRQAAGAVAELAQHHQVVVTHGNGPQIGLLALQAAALPAAPPTPLDVLGAESEGMLGYLIEQEISNALPGREIATLLTQVVVDAGDPAFASPTKPIGPFYDVDEARRLERQRGWTFAPDRDAYRRVVPSPEPVAIRELDTIGVLLDAGRIVVCAGGGGIPVIVTSAGQVCGVEAVIDKDLCSARLAGDLGADVLLLLTDVPAVFEDWPRPACTAIRSASPADLERLAFAPGSMGPKVEAGCRFVRECRGWAAIGALACAQRVLDGEAGTRIGADERYRVERVESIGEGHE